MTSQQLQTAADATEGSDLDPVGRVDREIIRQVDLDRATALIERRSASGLLDELAGIVQSLEVADSRTVPRRGTIVGRLLGRDLSAQARARQAYEHVRIRLQLAERRAHDVLAHVRELDEASTHIARQRARLAETAERGREAFDAFACESGARPDAMGRRLDHLTLLLSSWDIAIAHLRLVRQYDELLLARYAHVRDVVVPQWLRRADAALADDEHDGPPPGEPLREALEVLLQVTAPQPAVFPRAEDVRV
ncbi:hypothetical protein DWG18_10745 [Lysobacter sp. TY2-98]|uniref:hypothetical protein n=1 Tax=Lysobacter sp. TY2-98 TaxID=2290922 RepID=UPI000E20470E|nr:hypothetical protein [Lysobacter sp. TY2-98]AXK72703.1 hypothetical protein DWG18_10745 [Lysobacter sp. TY2-98]